MSAVARFLIAISLWLVTAAAVADVAPVAGDAASTRPNAGGDPDVITVRLGVLDIDGCLQSGIYQSGFEAAGLAPELPTEDELRELMTLIKAIKGGKQTDATGRDMAAPIQTYSSTTGKAIRVMHRVLVALLAISGHPRSQLHKLQVASPLCSACGAQQIDL